MIQQSLFGEPKPMTDDYKRKVDFAIMLLRSIPQDCEIELSYSGGKDSDVILELAKMAGIPFRAIYKNTTIDPPYTLKHVKQNGVEIIQPKKRFFELVKQKGCPTMRARFCCSELKEYKVCDRAIQGIRRSESVKRASRYKEPEICRSYSHKEDVRVYFPILEWTNEDVKRFISERGIQCHPLYYDENGAFHVERRLGCLGCPLRSDRGVGDYVLYPKLLRQLIKSAQEFIDTHTQSSSKTKFGNAYHLVFHNLFFNTYEEYKTAVTGGLFTVERIEPKAFLEDYFKVNLTL